MAGADGYIKIDTRVDESGLDKGLGEVDKKLKGSTKGAAGFASGLAKVGVAAAAATAAVKATVAIVNDLTDAYRTQCKAETQLEAAAKNNPYLNNASVSALKDYARELGNIAGIGDQELLPYMAQLATAGRTQAQIQEIMQVALDASASGAMSLDSAVRNLSKTYGGLAGELGETVPELRALSQEEMRQGGAVKLLGEKYKGMAAEVNKNVGSSQALKNSFTNLKEELGEPFEKALSPMRLFFANIINGWTESIKKQKEYAKAKKLLHDIEAGKAEAEPIKVLNAELEMATQDIVALQKEYNKWAKYAALEITYEGEITEQTKEQLDIAGKRLKEQQTLVDSLNKQITAEQTIIDNKTKADADETARAARNKEAADYVAKATAAREAAIKQIELQAKAEGVLVDQQEIIDAYINSYVSLVGESNGLITENNGAAKALLETIKTMVDEYNALTAAEDKNLERQEAAAEAEKERLEKAQKLREDMQSALDAITEEVPESERMKEQLAILDSLQESAISNEQITVDEKLAIQEEYFEKRKILLRQIEAAEKAEAAAEVADRRAKTIESLEIANTFAQQYQRIMTDIQALVSEQIANEEKIKTAELQKQYESGAISAEEYEEKLTDIKRQAAKDKYKIDMWAWSANIAAAIANTALAATKALADGGALLAAAVIAAGGVQLASLIAAKPIPPAFASGGIVPGTSYTGDKVVGRLNSGEMVWNAAQQKALWNKVQSGDWGSDGVRVQVYNSASNLVRAEPTVDQDGIRIAIRQVVKKDMADGRFNTSMRRAQQGMRGTRYTN